MQKYERYDHLQLKRKSVNSKFYMLQFQMAKLFFFFGSRSIEKAKLGIELFGYVSIL